MPCNFQVTMTYRICKKQSEERECFGGCGHGRMQGLGDELQSEMLLEEVGRQNCRGKYFRYLP